MANSTIAARYNRCFPSYTCCLPTPAPTPPVPTSFMFSKVNQLGQPLSGAIYTITTGIGGNALQVALSDANGQLCFDTPAAGTYQLNEIVSPIGYQSQATATMVVDMMGNVTINGTPASMYQAVNVPLTVN